jgi:hypothetical protein
VTGLSSRGVGDRLSRQFHRLPSLIDPPTPFPKLSIHRDQTTYGLYLEVGYDFANLAVRQTYLRLGGSNGEENDGEENEDEEQERWMKETAWGKKGQGQEQGRDCHGRNGDWIGSGRDGLGGWGNSCLMPFNPISSGNSTRGQEQPA